MSDIFVAKPKNKEVIKETKEILQEKPVFFDNKPLSTDDSVHLFTSYCEHPDDISFENQDENERVILFIRKDFVTNLYWIVSGLFLIITPIILGFILSFLHIPIPALPQNYLLVLSIFYYLIIASFMFVNFITWYFNIDLVTEKRIIDIDFEGIVYKKVAATKLSLVQDVSYSQVGVVRTLFDYGDVLVQTAGTIDNFIFESVPRPEDAVHVVEGLIGKKYE